MVFQVIQLLRDRNVGVQKNPALIRAASTILILSLIYIICNTTSIIIWTSIYQDHLQNVTMKGLKPLSWLQLWLIYFSGTTLFLLSSTLTPLVVVLRGDAGRENSLTRFFIDLTQSVSKSTISKKKGVAEQNSEL